MEVLGAASSIIAVGQALTAVPKVINAVRIVSNAKEELNMILLELELLAAGSEHIEMCIEEIRAANPPELRAQIEPPYMRTLRSEVDKLVKRLQDLAQDCQKLSLDKRKPALFRAQWTWKRQTLLNLRENVRVVHEYLDRAMSMLQRQHTYKLQVQTLSVVVGKQPARSNSHYTICAGTHLGDTVFQEGSATSTVPISANQWGVSNMKVVYPAKSGRACTCLCHYYRPVDKRYWRPGGFFGQLTFSRARHSPPIPPGRRTCSCCPRDKRLAVTYKFPTWLWGAGMSLEASFNPLCSIQLALNMPSVIRSNLDVWDGLWSLDDDQAVSLIRQRSYKPVDAAPDGESLLEYAFRMEQWSTVLYYMNCFGHLLHNDGIISKVAMMSRAWLYRNSPTDFEAYVCRRIIAFADEEPSVGPAPLHEAVRSRGDLRAALQADPSAIDLWDDTGQTALHLACCYENIDALRCLIASGADIDTQNIDGRTPLHIAAAEDLVEFAAALLDANADVEARDYRGMTPLLLALGVGNLADEAGIIALLIKRGASIFATDTGRRTCLHWLAYTDRSDSAIENSFKALVQSGASSLINAVNDTGQTALCVAALFDNIAMMRLLLAAGARVDITRDDGYNLLHIVVLRGTVETMKLLQDAKVEGLDIRTSDTLWTHQTPIGELRDAINHSGDMLHPGDRRPTLEEIDAFEALLRDIRDRAIVEESNRLESVVEDIKAGEIAHARETLKELVKVKERARIEWEAKTFRAIDLDLRQGMLELAMESLEEFVAASRGRMDVSPFDEEEYDWADTDEEGYSDYSDRVEELSADSDDVDDDDDDECSEYEGRTSEF